MSVFADRGCQVPVISHTVLLDVLANRSAPTHISTRRSIGRLCGR